MIPPKLVSHPGENGDGLGASLLCVTLPLPSSSASDFLPPTLEPGTWNPLALRSSAGSATPRPLWTLMGGREKQLPGWAAASSSETSKEVKDKDLSRRKFGDAAAPRRNATRLGHTFAPRGCLERARRGGTCLGPRAGPAIHSSGHLATATRSMEPVAPKPWAPPLPSQPSCVPTQPVGGGCPAAPCAPSRREGRGPAPGSSLAAVGPPPSRLTPPSQPLQIPESPGPRRHPGGF